jgi:hypothetical protein
MDMSLLGEDNTPGLTIYTPDTETIDFNPSVSE